MPFDSPQKNQQRMHNHPGRIYTYEAQRGEDDKWQLRLVRAGEQLPRRVIQTNLSPEDLEKPSMWKLRSLHSWASELLNGRVHEA